VRRILITGGTGFVGRHLIRLLTSSASKLTVVSSTPPLVPEPDVDYCTADIRNQDDIRAVIRTVSPEHIYHLAGISSVLAASNNPRLTFDVNVIGAYNVLEAAMSLSSPPRILNVSTAQVYGSSDIALTESSRLDPENPYAASKAMAELLTVQYKKSAAGGIITARAFNHTGPGQVADFVLPSFAKQLAEMEAGLRPPVLKVGNINVSRDFTDVHDVVIAYCELLEKGNFGEVYNVCSGRPVLLADVVKELQKNCNVDTTIEIDPTRFRQNEAPRLLGDPRKIRALTGWIPRVPLETTVKDLLAYWRKRINGSLADHAGPHTRTSQANLN
jgi:GDP-4-dehydro-6-deoxy-D-mannose reductase